MCGSGLRLDSWREMCYELGMGMASPKNKLFKLVTNYQPTGDQPLAIENIVNGLNEGQKSQVLFRGHWLG